MEPEPAAPAEADPSLEHDVVVEEDEHTKYPAALASHETVLEDKQLFLGLLQDLCTKLQDAEPKKFRPTKFRVPTAAGQDLDLQKLYRCTTQLGGAIAVSEQQRWPDVIRPMQFPSKVNTAAIRKIYSQLLWHFEQVYFHGAAGQPLLEPPELVAANAAAAALQAAAADRQAATSSAPVANGNAGRARPARSRKGPSLAALIAAEDQISSGIEDGDGFADGDDSQSGSEDGAAGSEDEDGSAAGTAAAAAPVATGGAGEAQQGTTVVKKPVASALLAAAAPTAAGTSPSAAPAAAAAAANAAPGATPADAGTAAAAQQAKPRNRPPQQRSSVAAPGKTPELTAFHRSGRHRRDLTGAAVSGKVEARFDCGYFVSITVGGMQFGGVLYCPTGTGTAGAAGAQGQQSNRAAAVKRENSAALGSDAVAGSSRKPPVGGGGGSKREAGAAGLEGEGGGAAGGGGSRAAKRRRSGRDLNDPALANKPKSAKTAFNYFAAEQWAHMRSELGTNSAPQDISRMIGERWNKTPEDERAPYIAQAAADKARFEREMETWRTGLEAAAVAAAADSAAAAVAAGEGDAAAGNASASAAEGGTDAMDVDTAAAPAALAAVKQEQRAATPPRPVQPRLKLKMSGGSRHTPPPAAAAAPAGSIPPAAEAAAAPVGDNAAAPAGAGAAETGPVAAAAPAAAQAGPPAAPDIAAAAAVPDVAVPQLQQERMPAQQPGAAAGPGGSTPAVVAPTAPVAAVPAVPAVLTEEDPAVAGAVQDAMSVYPPAAAADGGQ